MKHKQLDIWEEQVVELHNTMLKYIIDNEPDLMKRLKLFEQYNVFSIILSSSDFEDITKLERSDYLEHFKVYSSTDLYEHYYSIHVSDDELDEKHNKLLLQNIYNWVISNKCTQIEYYW